MRTTEENTTCLGIPEAHKDLVDLKGLAVDLVMSSEIFLKIFLEEEDEAALGRNKDLTFNIILNYPLRKPYTEKKLN